jgi:hypothetical protein
MTPDTAANPHPHPHPHHPAAASYNKTTQGRLHGAHGPALVGLALAGLLVVAGCGGGGAASPEPRIEDFTNGLLTQAGPDYKPLLSMAGQWARCNGQGRLDQVTVSVADAAQGTVLLQGQQTDYFSNNDCSGTPVARAQRVRSDNLQALQTTVSYNWSFVSRNYSLPPDNEPVETAFWAVYHNAPTSQLSITGTTTTAAELNGVPQLCFNRTANDSVCLPNTEITLASPGNLRAVRLDRSLDPEALYLFTMIKKTPPADLEIWYRRVATTPAPA